MLGEDFPSTDSSTRVCTDRVVDDIALRYGDKRQWSAAVLSYRDGGGC